MRLSPASPLLPVPYACSLSALSTALSTALSSALSIPLVACSFYDLKDAIGDIGRKLANSMSRTNAGVPRPEQIQPRPTSVAGTTATGPGMVAPVGAVGAASMGAAAVGGAGLPSQQTQAYSYPQTQPMMGTGVPLAAGASAALGSSGMGTGMGTGMGMGQQQLGQKQYASGGGIGAQEYAGGAPMQVPSIAPQAGVPAVPEHHRPVPPLPVGASTIPGGISSSQDQGLGVGTGSIAGYAAASDLPVSTAK